MKSLLERITWVKIVEGVLLVILGVLIAVLGGLYHEEIGNALAICIAVFLFIDGLLTLFGFLLDPKSNFSFTTVLGCLFITIGVLLCVNTSGEGISQLIGMFVAVLLLTSGIVYLVKGCIQISIKAPIGWIIMNFLIAALGISLGTVSIIYYQGALAIVFIIIGIAISVLGVVDLIFAIIKYRNKLKEAPVQADVAETVNGDDVVVETNVKEKKHKFGKHKKAKQIAQKEPKLLAESDNKEVKTDDKVETPTDEVKTDDDHKDVANDEDKVIDAEVK